MEELTVLTFLFGAIAFASWGPAFFTRGESCGGQTIFTTILMPILMIGAAWWKKIREVGVDWKSWWERTLITMSLIALAMAAANTVTCWASWRGR